MKDLIANKFITGKKVFKHFIATVYIDNGFKGVQFRFNAKDAASLCLPKLFSHTSRYLGEKYYHNGMVIIPIEENQHTDIPESIPEDYLNLLRCNKNFTNPRIEPVIGTVIFGKYKGLIFSLFGTKEIDLYFSRSSVQRTMRGERKFHRSCLFRHATHREAIPYHGKLTQEVHEDLLLNKCLKKFKTSR